MPCPDQTTAAPRPATGEAAEARPLSAGELEFWSGMMRVHAMVMEELDRRLLDAHELTADAYGLMLTLSCAPGGRLTIGELGERRHLTPSGISRAIDRLAAHGLLERTSNPADRRSLLVGLTPAGTQRLRQARETHHSTVRERLLTRLDEHELQQLAGLWERVVPGSPRDPVWPP